MSLPQYRRSIVAVVMAAHLVMLAVVVAIPRAEPAASHMTAITMLAITPPVSPVITAKVLHPPAAVPAAIIVAIPVAAPTFDVAALTSPAVIPVEGADTCGLTEAVATILRENNAVSDALRLVPARARSVANAIALWNGAWVDAASIGGPAALDPIRATLAARISAAPDACQSAAVTGPRLFLVAQASGTAIISIGSGVWAWGQLL